MKRVEKAAGSGFVQRARDLGHNWPYVADALERDGTHNFLGYTLHNKFGEEYREHMRHYRCTVDINGQVIGRCSTRDARLTLQDDNSKRKE
ncbi:hypothetical protein [Microbacterium sp. NPDC089696]|uniref:hypothetical protein n=1 Tax=Microbacterium sp. NPDC089696 TaxID=3364199 RepID=UPI0037FE6E18